ncbi:GNAT family N-acetyltransferase [Ornithinibacillus xuwenensis]|uniref:GNAT family N-acetyltransferase n=1 Tax=Ornithinibacillus xuwenensis TaxID=3144668 RepID=A0ABU9XKI1_9BACI
MTKSVFLQEEKNKEELKQELDTLEIQLYRMQNNIKEIAKKSEVISIDQTPNEEWVVVYADREEESWQIMLHSCKRTFRGNWNSALQAEMKDDNTIHISAIKGEENKGYGTVLMQHLKEIAREENVQYITGDLVKRDFDHVDRLQHFYEKHNFDVTVDHEEKCGEIVWNDE